MKISLSKEDLKKPHTDRSRYDLEDCHSCGREFLRHNGVSHTGVDGEEEFTVWCCSNNCLDWFHNRNPSYKAQKAIERRQANSDLSKWRVVNGPPDVEIGSNPYQSVIDATERIKAKPPIDDPCLWCGYSMEDEPAMVSSVVIGVRVGT